MAEKGNPGPVCDLTSVRESVCIHTKKIFDSCRDKDCIEDLRFYPTAAAQEILFNCQIIKGGTAELLYVYTDVAPVKFHRGYYSVDMRFFYRVTLQVSIGTPRCADAEGLCVFDKRCILFGSEGGARIFTSHAPGESATGPCTDVPMAVVEAVDPIVLDTRIADGCPGRCGECCPAELPQCIQDCFAQDLVMDDSCHRRYYVTLGQFTLVRLERDTQLLIPIYDYCIPQSECCGGDKGDPCSLFKDVPFPVGEFFPPNALEPPCDYAGTREYCSRK